MQSQGHSVKVLGILNPLNGWVNYIGLFSHCHPFNTDLSTCRSDELAVNFLHHSFTRKSSFQESCPVLWHACHISHCEIKSQSIWPIWKPIPIRFFKSHRIFRQSYEQHILWRNKHIIKSHVVVFITGLLHSKKAFWLFFGSFKVIFVKVSQNFIKSPLKICLISQISVHSLWHVRMLWQVFWHDMTLTTTKQIDHLIEISLTPISIVVHYLTGTTVWWEYTTNTAGTDQWSTSQSGSLVLTIVVYSSAGTTLSLHIYGLHHNKHVWDRPMEYIPERFSKENVANMDPFQFVPFSAGPR